MLFGPLALAAAATAFVVVPEMSEKDENIFKALPVDSSSSGSASSYGIPESAFDQSISVPCGDCKGRHIQLRLDFTIEDETRLLLNGFELYPDADPWSGELQATVSGGHRKSKVKKLGYSLAVYPKAVAKEDNMELIDVDLKIIEVGTRFVEGVPAVRVELIRAPGGSLAMSTVGFDQQVETPCTTIWCRAKELADELWAQAQEIKGCGKAAISELKLDSPDMASSNFDLPDTQYTPSITEPTISSLDEWRHLLETVAGHVIMPIVMGVTAGVAVAFLALCIHNMARRLGGFVRRRRNDERRRNFCKASCNEHSTAEEKAQLMA
ncbi:hypothetical protein LLEC1_03248 [Akanthomyces lecanii]|uniref:DUF7728 domain-containing protein n=1 Tax=Cordyceps confragosa TaxID=2714763 RepID=A0A179IQ40_CORDF|nr:hypothetical protein LLEC1_03248 [Akanthomyces lecanii]